MKRQIASYGMRIISMSRNFQPPGALNINTAITG